MSLCHRHIAGRHAKNWQGRLELLEEMTIEEPKAPSCETLQASRGWGQRSGCTPLQSIRGGGSGERCKLPSGVRGGDPEVYEFLTFELYIVLKMYVQFTIL